MEAPGMQQSGEDRPQHAYHAGTMRRWAPRALVLSMLFWLGSREWYYSAWMDDDAFISFRFARNLARGLGLVFNPGERVEGYSNFLWTVMLAALHRIGADLPTAAQILGAAFSILTVVLLLKWGPGILPSDRGRQTGATAWLGYLSAGLLCVLEPWAVWAVGGLENSLGGFLVLAAFVAYFQGLLDRGSLVSLSGALCAFAALTNPSFALFGMVLGAHILARTLRRQVAPRTLAAFIAPIVVIGLPYLAWKHAYYGHWLPNTFQAKVGFRWAVLNRGFHYYGDVFKGLPLPILTLVAAPILLGLRGVRDARPWLLFAATITYCAYTIGIGGEAFPAFRLLIVTLPLQLLLVQYVIALLAESAGRIVPAPAVVLTALIAMLATWIPGYLSGKVRVLDDAIRADTLGLFRAAALMLKEHFPSDILLAGSGAGVIPYYSEFRFLDTLGLTDAHIAARQVGTYGTGTAGHEKGNGRYVFERKPHVIMFGSGPVSGFDPCFLSDYELLAIPDFNDHYEQVALFLRFCPRNQAEKVGYVPLYVRK